MMGMGLRVREAFLRKTITGHRRVHAVGLANDNNRTAGKPEVANTSHFLSKKTEIIGRRCEETLAKARARIDGCVESHKDLHQRMDAILESQNSAQNLEALLALRTHYRKQISAD